MFNGFGGLDDLLDRISIRLQLSQKQYELAERRYNDVGKWLAAKESKLANVFLQIYPQGSLKTRTTVRPIHQQEYDLDLICELQLDWRKNDPVHVLKFVEERLKEEEKYAAIIKSKARCIRLDYPGEFHLDVVPACPIIERENGYVMIPDKEVKDWRDSNPKGYADWFENQSTMQMVVEKAAAIEPLPEPESVKEKPPLKRVVQLMKRFRDIYFKENQESAPASILLTTLAGKKYRGQASIKNALSEIVAGIRRDIAMANGRLLIFNPANTTEELSERWKNDPELYEEFVEWVKQFDQIWMEINQSIGLQKISKLLGQMFGEEITEYAIKEQAEFVEAARKKRILRATPAGLIVTKENAGKTILPNTFYGSAK